MTDPNGFGACVLGGLALIIILFLLVVFEFSRKSGINSVRKEAVENCVGEYYVPRGKTSAEFRWLKPAESKNTEKDSNE